MPSREPRGGWDIQQDEVVGVYRRGGSGTKGAGESMSTCVTHRTSDFESRREDFEA